MRWVGWVGVTQAQEAIGAAIPSGGNELRRLKKLLKGYRCRGEHI